MQNQQINLLKAMVIEETRADVVPVWVPWVLALLILLSGGGIYKKTTEITALQHDISGLEQKKSFLIEEMGAAEAAMKDVVHILAVTLSNRIRWSELMREVSMVIPEGVWITRWESLAPTTRPQTDKTQDRSSQGPDEMQIKISGEALSQEQLNLFLLTLERSPLLIESRLTHARKINKEVQFELIVSLKMEKPR